MIIYLEFHVKGNSVAVVDASTIAAVMTRGLSLEAKGNAAAPVMVILKGHPEGLEVIGQSVVDVLARIAVAKEQAKAPENQGAIMKLDRMDPI